jgi:hypothetical protein
MHPPADTRACSGSGGRRLVPLPCPATCVTRSRSIATGCGRTIRCFPPAGCGTTSSEPLARGGRGCHRTRAPYPPGEVGRAGSAYGPAHPDRPVPRFGAHRRRHPRRGSGIRRKATDVYEDYESDERVLNDQTGHRNSETRRNAYQEREREEIRASPRKRGAGCVPRRLGALLLTQPNEENNISHRMLFSGF